MYAPQIDLDLVAYIQAYTLKTRVVELLTVKKLVSFRSSVSYFAIRAYDGKIIVSTNVGVRCPVHRLVMEMNRDRFEELLKEAHSNLIFAAMNEIVHARPRGVNFEETDLLDAERRIGAPKMTRK